MSGTKIILFLVFTTISIYYFTTITYFSIVVFTTLLKDLATKCSIYYFL